MGQLLAREAKNQNAPTVRSWVRGLLALIFIVLFLIFPSVKPLFNSGFFPVHDNTQVERVFELKKAISDGNFPVRWVEDLGYGYGYPIYNFYAPLPYYIGGFTNLLANDSLFSTKVVFMLGVVLSFISMYLFASRVTNRVGGVTAAVIYLYFPYHAVNIYIRGAVGEVFAYAIIPLVFLAAYLIFEKISKKKNIPIIPVLLFSISFFLLTISHNLSVYMSLIILVPYLSAMFIKIKRKKVFAASIFISFALSFLLSSFYVLPAVFESKFTNVESQIGGGASYGDHFLCIEQLWNSSWGFGGSIPGCVDGLSFKLGKINVLIALFGIIFSIYLVMRKKKSFHLASFSSLLVFSIFLSLPYSKFIWDSLPFMYFLQFPWRFLNFSGLFAAIIAGLIVSSFSKNKLAFYGSALVLIITTMYLNAKLFSPERFNNFPNSYYESIDRIRWETSKISDEYMPSDFIKPKKKSELPETFLTAESDRVKLSLQEVRTGYIRFVKEGNDSTVHINKAYFPSWQAEANGSNLEIERVNNGMNIYMPDGEYLVTLSIKSTRIQLLGNVFTVIGIAAVFAVIIVKRKNIYG